MSEAGWRLRVNGEARLVPEGTTLPALLESLGLDSRTVAIELDGRIVRRSAPTPPELHDGARLEIVRFVQGG